MPNRLANETSPYLLQHKDNPVDWYAWGDEAFAAARDGDKPVILSVGYSACHWCHVMEHESFENDAIAALMNENFVSIKVDREERPDIDAIYMQAVQALTGRGGWPMTVFMTPEGLPFYGGTYYPPEDRQGMPGFPRVLNAVVEAYKTRRNELQAAGEQMRERLATPGYVRPGDRLVGFELLDDAFDAIKSAYDPDFGGFGRAPKFPQPMTLDFLLRQYHRTHRESALEMVTHTLDAMAFGGMYDQVGGGFHRYSTDAVWLVPHFEKMLYDNALLARIYLDAFKATSLLRYRRVTEETLHYVLREMTDPSGAFYSTQDADSEGEEGKFFLWTPGELVEALGSEDAALAGEFFGVTKAGNFEGKNILHVPQDPERFAESHGLSLEALTRLVGEAKLKLYEARKARVHPARDDKVLTAWNGLMLRAMAEAGFTLDEPRYVEAATRNADFLLNTMRPNGRLLRTWKHGLSTDEGHVLSGAEGQGVAKLNGYLEDYANLIDGLLATHTASLEPRFLLAAIELADEMLDLFWDDEAEGFYDTGRDHETLITRPRDLFDNASPAGTSVAADVLLRLAAITGNETYEQHAVACLRAVAPIVEQAPTAFGRLLCTLDYHLARPQELAIVLPSSARPEALEGCALADVVRSSYLPHLVVVGGPEGSGDRITLLKDRPARDGKPTAYLCERFVCQAPTTGPEELQRQLSLL